MSDKSVIGPIAKIAPVESIPFKDKEGKSKQFKKRIFSVFEEGKYSTEEIKMEFHGDACEKLDKFDVGDEVEVKFNFRGRRVSKGKHKGSLFSPNVIAWYIRGVDVQPQQETPPDVEEDDLPF